MLDIKINSDANDYVDVYTDGACSGNPGPGGWGVLIQHQGTSHELSGGELMTTNNRMELTAVIQALTTLQQVQSIKVYTDSLYVRDGVTQWLQRWKQNGWKTAQKTPVKNIDLWQQLDVLVATNKKIEWHWIKGHSGHSGNDRADLLARNAIVQQIMQSEVSKTA